MVSTIGLICTLSFTQARPLRDDLMDWTTGSSFFDNLKSMAFTILLPIMLKGSLFPAFYSTLSFGRKSEISCSHKLISGSVRATVLSLKRLESVNSVVLIYSGGMGRFLDALADYSGIV